MPTAKVTPQIARYASMDLVPPQAAREAGY
jgi:hypothetical protein